MSRQPKHLLSRGQRHPTVKVRSPWGRLNIDEKLAPLLCLLWRAGLQTNQCCQEVRPGLAEIEFAGSADAENFLYLAQRPYVPKLEIWDEHEEGDKLRFLPRIRLLVRFPSADIPALIQEITARIASQEG